MKAKKGWRKMKWTEMLAEAERLLVWNCNQPVSNAEHRAHYLREIKPIYDEHDRQWKEFFKRELSRPVNGSKTRRRRICCVEAVQGQDMTSVCIPRKNGNRGGTP